MIDKYESALKSIGFTSHEIVLINTILEDESINLKALLRQSLSQWQGHTGIKFPPSSITD